MRDGWYYAEGNKSVGPSTFTALTEHLSKASDPGKVKVWHIRLQEWQAAKALQRPLYTPWQRAKPVREQGRTPEVELSSLSS